MFFFFWKQNFFWRIKLNTLFTNHIDTPWKTYRWIHVIPPRQSVNCSWVGSSRYTVSFRSQFLSLYFLKHFISPTQERLISFHAFQEWYEGHSLTISFCDENSQELNEKTRKLWKGCGKAKPCNSGKFNWESSWQTLHFVWVLNETTYVFQFQYPRLLIIWSPTL